MEDASQVAEAASSQSRKRVRASSASSDAVEGEGKEILDMTGSGEQISKKIRRSTRVQEAKTKQADDKAATESSEAPSRKRTRNISGLSTNAQTVKGALKSAAKGVAASNGEDLGKKPTFPFKANSLSKLDQVPLAHSAGRSVCVLATVMSKVPRPAPYAYIKELVLADSSRKSYGLVIWQQDRDVSDIRVGDVIYAGPCEVDSHNGKLQLRKIRDKLIKVEICWRTRQGSSGSSNKYRFHRGWADKCAEAKAVLEEVDAAMTATN
ncbi:hypothetical protein JCM10908_004396 [Rhodotorula pacifica]|uniref:uncharacterized protein n=1 Tax=Rhodotorula pacifica TaxID=1495444 RepID=UPI003170BCAD